MPKMVIEVPEELTEVGKAMAERLAALERTLGRLGGGKAVDYAEVERAMSDNAGRTELAAHRAILQSLDMDVPAVVIGGVRYTRVGRCEAPYHTMVGSVSVERSLYRQSGERGGQPGGKLVDPVKPARRRGGRRLAAAHGAGDGACGAARHVTGSGSDRGGVWPPALLAREFRAGGALGRGPCGSPRH